MRQFVEHQRLVDYINQEALRRSLTVTELARDIKFNENHIGNIMRGQQPGLDVCLRLARAFKLRPDYVLFLAGHITEEELDAPQEIPAELLPTIHKLSRMRGTPFFDTATKLIIDVINQVENLFKVAA
jgi:plasmid maintenance system antidote protein VapI